MSCEFSRESISSYLDGRLTEPEGRSVVSHMASCRECAATHDHTVRLRSSLRSLPSAPPPDRLDTDLRILASKEIVRRRRMSRVPALAGWMDRARLLVENLMRPLALPFAGGLTSALFMFAVLIPSLEFLRTTAHDTPSPIYTVASVNSMDDDFSFRSKVSDDTVVEVQVDGQGHMVDYNVLEGKMTSEVGNLLLFATFTPATSFWQPTSGKVIIRRSRIVVKG